MKINSILKVISGLSLTLVSAKRNDCLDLYKKYANSINECSNNKNGQVESLDFSSSKFSTDEINPLFSYDSLKDLKYEYAIESYSDDEENPFLNFTFSLNSLKNLEKLNIGTYRYELNSGLGGPGITTLNLGNIAPGTLKGLNNLKNITLQKVVLNQTTIDEIAALPNVEQLVIDHCNLENVNLEVLTNIKDLTLQSVNLTKKNYEQLYSLNNLESLKFYQQSIYEDNFNLISQLTNLKNLSISSDRDGYNVSSRYNDEYYSFNSLNDYKLEIIGTLTNLESLTIGISKSYNFKFSPLKNLSQLKYLYLYPNSSFDYSIHDYEFGSLSYEDGDFENFKNLKTLKIGHDKLTQSNYDEISKITTIEELVLEHIDISDINLDSLENLKNLKSLTFDGVNYNNDIPKFIFSLKNLKKLYLSQNSVNALPTELGNLKNLESLTCKWNIITDKDFTLIVNSLPNLTYLDLYDNRIENIPKEISNLKNLKYIDIGYNKISSIPEELFSLKDLEHLDLQMNKLNGVLSESFNELVNLTFIDLSNNEDLSGETLKNKKIINCGYKNTGICQAKESLCFYNNENYHYGIYKPIDKCSNYTEEEEEEETTTIDPVTSTVVEEVTTVEPVTTTTEVIEPTETSTPNEVTCKALELGYQCCTHCHSIYEDKTGLWGAEHGKWCGIPDHCSENYDSCWSIKHGYPCCDHCKSIYTDKHGKWGVLNKDWCGIPTSCQ